MRVERQKRYRMFLIAFAYLIMVLMGMNAGASLYGMPREREYFYSLTVAFVLTHICIVDSRIVGRPLSIFSYWLVLMFYQIAVPACIVRSRGFPGLKIVVAHFIGLVLTFYVVWFVTFLLVCGI